MSERRTSNIMVNLEPSLMNIVDKLLAKEEISASSYCRLLIMNDLNERGLLPVDILIKIT